MAIDILSNCHFDATRVSKLYLGVALSTGGTINFPVNYHTLSGSSDSIIKYESWDATNVVQIGQQNIQFEEVYWAGENITFTEELIIDQRGRNYVKTLTFELSGIDQTLVDQLEALGLDHEGMLCPPKTLAILIDENENELIAGYDFPFRLESITTGINGDQNSITLTYISNSHSRARNAGFPTPSPSPTPTISVSSSITPSVSVSPFLTPTPSISVTQFSTPTPTITPSCVRNLGIGNYQNLYLYYSGATGVFTGSISDACLALEYMRNEGCYTSYNKYEAVIIANQEPHLPHFFEEGTPVYSGHNRTDCTVINEGYYIYTERIILKGGSYWYSVIVHIESGGNFTGYIISCPTPSISVTPSVTSTPNISVTPSITPTINPTLTPSISITSSVTPTISLTPTITITPTITPSISRSITPTMTPSTTPILQLELIYQNLGNVQPGNYYGIPSIYVSWDNGSITGQTSAYTINGSSRIGVVNVATPTLPSALWNTNVTFTITRTICGSSPVYNTTRRALIGYSDSYFEDLNQTGLNESVGFCPAGTTHSYVFTPFTLSSSERNVRIMWVDFSEI